MSGENICYYLKTQDNGNSFTWSFRAFKTWKKKFQNEYKKQTGDEFKSVFQSSGEREAIYKRVFKMEGIDVFGNKDVNNTKNIKVEQSKIEICLQVANLL